MMLNLLWCVPAIGRRACAAQSRRPYTLSGIAGVLMLTSAASGPTSATAKTLRLNCTNPASGTSFPIVVDLDHNRVGTLDATITGKWISWHDPQQGFFDLDRTTGKLRLRNASSTGGYFLNYVCRPGL